MKEKKSSFLEPRIDIILYNSNCVMTSGNVNYGEAQDWTGIDLPDEYIW